MRPGRLAFAQVASRFRRRFGRFKFPLVFRLWTKRYSASLLYTEKNDGSAGAEIAVLYRDNRDAFPIARMLEKFGVPFVIESDEDILRDGDMRKLLLLFRAVSGYGNDELLGNALHADFLKIEPLDVYKLISAARHERVPLYDALRAPAFHERAGIKDSEKLAGFGKLLSGWAGFSKNHFWKKLLSWWLGIRFPGASYRFHRPVHGLDKLGALFDEAKALVERQKMPLSMTFVLPDTVERSSY